jgi:hypothetical protein
MLSALVTREAFPGPGFFKVLAVPMNWMRLADPLAPLFMRGASDQDPPIAYFKRNGLPTDLGGRAAGAFEILRDGLVADGMTCFARAGTPEEIMEANAVTAEVQVPGSPAKVFLRLSQFAHVDFGIFLPDPGTCNGALRAWHSLFVDRENGLAHALRFLFAWMRERPLAGCSQEVGLCIFLALLNAVVGVDVLEPLPLFAHIELMAWLSSSFENFIERFAAGAALRVAARTRVTHLPVIEDGLPNMRLRYLALLMIKEDDFGFHY